MAVDSRPDGSLSRKGRIEVTIILSIILALFLGARALPIAKWLKLAVEHESSYLDEMIFVFAVLSLVFPVFSVVRWLDLRREVAGRTLLVRKLEDGTRINAQLSQMTNLLHSCFELQEASHIISHYARHLFPKSAGALYIFKASRNILEMAADWGEEVAHEPTVAPQHCWALRQGQMYEVQNADLSILCHHLQNPRPYICLPMMAHGEVLALLHIHSNYDAETDLSSCDAHRSLLRVFAEYIALALSNLKLRDTLHQQSIRDPLTGLFNRRYLEEALLIETERAKRKNELFSIMMFDLDNFKRFNDSHGHDAGDAVLGELGRFLQRQVRGGDIACRYGGEEFTVVLPGASLESAEKRAEELCAGVRTLVVDFKGQSLGTLSLSVGVATFPTHGETAELVLQAADAALYQAKNEGRDRVSVAI